MIFLNTVREPAAKVPAKLALLEHIKKDFQKNKVLYLMLLPGLAFYIVFHYAPIYGAIIAFKDYVPSKGILGSEWVGFQHFIHFAQSHHFWRILKNTLFISVYSLLFEFPMPILLAIMISEVRNGFFKKTVQTITYIPHFISLVVICGLIKEFTNSGGIISDIVVYFGGDGMSMLQKPEYFRTIYIVSEIWQKIGWDSIIFLAALMAVDYEQYEAAIIDGASKMRQIWHITLPGISTTIVIMLILRIGKLLNVGFEKIILLYNPLTYDTADVISSFVYRKGIVETDWSFSAAIGLFNSVVNFLLLVGANRISKRINDGGLW